MGLPDPLQGARRAGRTRPSGGSHRYSMKSGNSIISLLDTISVNLAYKVATVDYDTIPSA
jgi:hypothetical protein